MTIILISNLSDSEIWYLYYIRTVIDMYNKEGFELKEGESVTDINFGLKMIQRDGGFVFGTDALLLAAFIKSFPRKRAVDLGCGSGAISLLCAVSGKFDHIEAIELQSEYAELCERNVCLNGLSDLISVTNNDIRNLISGHEKFDVVFTNPPYMRSDSGKHAHNFGRNASRHELNGGISDFCSAAAAALEWGGVFYAVYRPDRLVDLFSSMRNSGIEPKRCCFVQKDLSHAPSLVLVEGIRGGKCSLAVMPSLLLSEDNGKTTSRAEFIYRTLNFNFNQ